MQIFLAMKKNEESETLFTDFNFTGFNEDEPVFETSSKEETDEDDTGDDDDVDDDVELDDEDDVDVTTGVEKKQTPSDESKRSSSSFKVLAKVLSDEGVLSSFKEDTKMESAEDLIGAIQGEINARVEHYKNSLPDEVKELVEGFDEGVNVSDMVAIQRDLKAFDSIKDDDFEDKPELMKQVIARDLHDRGMSDDDIEEELEDIFSLGKEDVKSRKALERIKSRLKTKKEQLTKEAKETEAKAEKAYQERMVDTRKGIEELKEFAGIELTKKIKEEIFDSMVKPVAELNGTPINAIVKKRLEDPMAFDRKMATLFVLTKGFEDLSRFGGPAKRSAIKELEAEAEKISRNLSTGIGAPSQRHTSSGRGTVLHDIDFKHIV